jgi:ubiquinone/menaquinone biosynthesis C-methylase UbiE
MKEKNDAIQEQAREQFARQSHRYASGHILADVSDVQAALDRIDLAKGSRVLDVATGAGFTGLHLAKLGHHATLADLAGPMLERAREKACALGLAIDLREHPAESMPYRDESFDLVTCRVAAHHFSSPQKFVSETARVLKPGGYFILIDGTVSDDHPVAEEWMHQVEKLRDPSHHRFLTPLNWVALCDSSDLEVAYQGLTPFKQPDLNWYFETAATSEDNRRKVLQLVEEIPAEAKELFQLNREDGKIVWWWQRLTLIARKQIIHA